MYDLEAIDGSARGDGSRRRSALRPTPTSRGRSTASRLRFFPGTGADTVSLRPRSTTAPTCGASRLLGCDALLSASAVGSLREELAPRPGRHPGPVHRPDPPPARHVLRRRGRRARRPSRTRSVRAWPDALEDAAASAGLAARRGGTYVCMEGPQFSTRAESLLYRSWGADVIGMTNLTEAKLAREAEICYATPGARHRLRRVAGGERSRLGRGGAGRPRRELRRPRDGPCGRRSPAWIGGPRLRLPRGARLRDPDRPRGNPGGGAAPPRSTGREVPVILPEEGRVVVTGSVAFDYLMRFPGQLRRPPDPGPDAPPLRLVPRGRDAPGAGGVRVEHRVRPGPPRGEDRSSSPPRAGTRREYRDWLGATGHRRLRRSRSTRTSSPPPFSSRRTGTRTSSLPSTRARWRGLATSP